MYISFSRRVRTSSDRETAHRKQNNNGNPSPEPPGIYTSSLMILINKEARMKLVLIARNPRVVVTEGMTVEAFLLQCMQMEKLSHARTYSSEMGN